MKLSMTGSLKGLTGAAAVLAATLGVGLAGPHRAYAAPVGFSAPAAGGLGVTILSPDPHVPLSGVKPVEISAFYQGSPANQIVAIELFIDGAKAATKTLDVPETRGVVSFLVDAGQISAGTHRVVVRATAADQEVSSAKSLFTFQAGDAQPLLSAPTLPGSPLPPEAGAASGLPPTLRLIRPTDDGRVRGVITLRVEASDPSGKAPYISLFIDKTFKTLKNFAPYEFEWDTTAYANGYHTIEAYGYNDSNSVGHAKTLRLYVNNPGGETAIRRDLLDGPKTLKPIRAARPSAAARVSAVSKKRLERPLPLRRPAPGLTLGDAEMASLTPAHARSTREVLQRLEAGAETLRFGALDFAAELSTPFAAERQAAPERPAAPPAAPLRRFKPRAAAAATPPAAPEAGPVLAEIPDLAPASAGTARLERVASVQIPGSDLASPFIAVPHVSLARPAAARVSLARPRHARAAVKSALKLRAVRVRLSAGFGGLRRSVGQTILRFNQNTVTMDRPLTEQGGVLFGPLRQIFEQGGGTLTWESRTGTVRAKSQTKDIVLTIGSGQAVVNAKTVTLDGKPFLLLGRTMVPMSFVTAALDASVQFDPATGHLLITSRN